MQSIHIQAARFAAAALLALAALGSPAAAQGPSPVFVAPVAQQKTQEFERVLGSLHARQTSAMAALEEGALIELNVREADLVKAGTVIARIDARRLQASRAQVEADLAMGAATLAERQANHQNATEDLKALQAAGDSGAVSERDLRNARTVVQTTEALMQAATQSITALEAQRDLIDLRIADTAVRAPFDSRVVSRHAEIGQWIRPGDALVTLVSTGPLEAWLDLPERLVGRVATKAESVKIRLEATGLELFGRRARAIPTVDMRARTFSLILDVNPAQIADRVLELHPGMSISADIPVGQVKEHLVVPKNAVIRRGTDALVVTIDAQNIAGFAPVRVLFATADGFAIESLVPGGLNAGDTIIVEGNERIFPGTPVAPTPISEKNAEPKQAGQ